MLREAIVVVIVGSALGLTVGIFRGFPEVAQADDSDETAACIAPVPETPQILWVTQDTARRWLDDGAVFVDARTHDAFVTGHVAGALSVPMDLGTVPEDVVGMLRSASTVIAYCDTAEGCSRSTRLAGLLASAGLGNVHVLEGGLPVWLERNYPAEAGECRLCP